MIEKPPSPRTANVRLVADVRMIDVIQRSNMIVVTSQAVVAGHGVLVAFGAVAFLQWLEATCLGGVGIRVNCIFAMDELRFKEYDYVSALLGELMAACAILIP